MQKIIAKKVTTLTIKKTNTKNILKAKKQLHYNLMKFNFVHFLLSRGPSTTIIMVKTELPPITTTAKAANTYTEK